MSSRLLVRVAVACLLLPLLAAQPPRPFGAGGAGGGVGAGIDPASCGTGDCCWRESNKERFCACLRIIQQRGDGTCAAVDCAQAPPPGACDAPPRGGGMGGSMGGGIGGGGRGPGCVCTRIYAPVCADGKDYPNACEVRRVRAAQPLLLQRQPVGRRSRARALVRATSGVDESWFVVVVALMQPHGSLTLPWTRAQARCDGKTRFSQGTCAQQQAGGVGAG
jgi:hypothetical protein